MLVVTQYGGFGAAIGSGRLTVAVTIAATVTDYDLHADLVANHGWTGVDPIDATVTITAGVQCKASGVAAFGFRTGVFPIGSTVVLVNNGEIVGAGGAGGGSGAVGGAGGPALKVEAALAIDNANGEINGGGGGGGGGGNGAYCQSVNIKTGSCDGGCAVSNGGAGGNGYGPAAATGGGAGINNAGPGGSGGNKGAAGAAGGGGSGDVFCPGGGPGGAAGAAGAAVDGNTLVVWTNLGAINGARIN